MPKRARPMVLNQEELLFLESIALAKPREIHVVSQPAVGRGAGRGVRPGVARGHYHKPETSEPMSGLKRRIADIGLAAVFPMQIVWVSDAASYEWPVRKFKRVMAIASYLMKLPEGWLVQFVEWALKSDAIGREWQSAQGMPEPKADRRHKESRGVYLEFRAAPATARLAGEPLPDSGRWAEHTCGRCGAGRAAGRTFRWVKKRTRSGKTVRKPSAYCDDCTYWRRRGRE